VALGKTPAVQVADAAEVPMARPCATRSKTWHSATAGARKPHDPSLQRQVREEIAEDFPGRLRP
jgi:hypothetical protein